MVLKLLNYPCTSAQLHRSDPQIGMKTSMLYHILAYIWLKTPKVVFTSPEKLFPFILIKCHHLKCTNNEI